MQQAHKRNEYETKFWITSNHIFKILETLKLHVWCSLTMRIEIWVKMSKIFETHFVQDYIARQLSNQFSSI